MPHYTSYIITTIMNIIIQNSNSVTAAKPNTGHQSMPNKMYVKTEFVSDNSNLTTEMVNKFGNFF